MAKTLATQRSLRHLRKLGWQCAVVEKWQMRPQAKFGVRIDVWGFGDILACRYPEGAMVGQIALIQTFPTASWKKHAEKLAAIPELEYWKTCGGTILMHGWRFGGPRGKRKGWILKEERL